MAKIRITRVQARRARGERICVIIYCRVSTDDQEDNGTSLETQAEECRRWAELQGYIVIDVVQETHSGYELDQRKKFKSIMGRCANNEADGIVFRTYDRLSRNKTHFTVILYEAERHGYELFCVNEQFDLNNFWERTMREIVAIFAEFERAKFRERSETGRRKRAEEGKLINGGKPKCHWT